MILRAFSLAFIQALTALAMRLAAPMTAGILPSLVQGMAWMNRLPHAQRSPREKQPTTSFQPMKSFSAAQPTERMTLAREVLSCFFAHASADADGPPVLAGPALRRQAGGVGEGDRVVLAVDVPVHLHRQVVASVRSTPNGSVLLPGVPGRCAGEPARRRRGARGWCR
ncbi:hypothetical protein SFUMM280S_02409 [Streptomyces fumanus]